MKVLSHKRVIPVIVLGAITFATFWFSTQTCEAQIRLPKIFDRKNDTPPRGGNNDFGGTDGPQVSFIREAGIPTPQSRNVVTIKGHEITFNLTSITNVPGKTVEYVIRDFPTAGKIVLISNKNNRSTASAIYYADPNSGATQDSFTFKARYPGGTMSQLARVNIQIKDARSLLEVTEGADYGKVLIGQKVEREITLTNRGNAPYASRISMVSPWKVIQPTGGNINIPANSQIRIKIGYTPTYPGPSTYTLPFSSEKKGTCTLKAEAIAPFTLKANEWDMIYDPKTRTRQVEVVVVNNHSKPIEAYLRAFSDFERISGDRSASRLKLHGGSPTIFAPQTENRIKLSLAPDDVMPLIGGLEIKLRQGYSATAKIKSPTVAARLAIEVPNQISNEVINFGKVQAGRSLEKGIILKNLGGEIIAIDGAVSAPFRIRTRTDRQLAPLEALPIEIGFYPEKSDRGAADQILTFVGRDQQVKIRLVGNAIRPPGAPRDPIIRSTPPPRPKKTITQPTIPSPVRSGKVGEPAPSPIAASPDRLTSTPVRATNNAYPASRPQSRLDKLKRQLSPKGIVTYDLIDRERSNRLKSASDLELVKATAKSLQVSWTAPRDSEIDNFELEIRGITINPATQFPESVWAPYPKVEIKRVGRLVKAKILELTPYTTYEMRVVTVDVNGRASKPSKAFATMTTRTMDWTYIYLTLALIALGFLGWAIVQIIQARRGEEYRSEHIHP